ncbi:sensor histidine kinase [Demequina pelophila]|uniref:sensor histidine kinase n=1 Tax=Demequina pelophila TaxID=1638984 RepID=UPI000783BD30|nr:HAMP domain-containing sensor histidine kinase [Demequina pelophila]
MRSLRARLLASHLAVAAVGVIALVAVGGWVAGVLVERRVGRMRGMTSTADAREALEAALPAALGWGAAAGIASAAIAAALVARRVVRALAGFQEASRRIADGDYAHRIPPPPEAELAAVAADIDALAARLEEGETRRVRLIDEVAHEMRTPVTTIRGSMEALLDEVAEPTPEVFARVAAEAARLERLAADLSTLSRAEERALTLALAPADLAAIARDAADRLAPQFEHRGVALRVDGPGPVPVHADRDRVLQILINLLGNALAHTPGGGAVTLACVREGTTARATVTDTGRGIAPEHLDKVFERFYRVPGDDAPAGRGIGLTIARALARAHGGDLAAASEGTGRGASFTLTLPQTSQM